MEWALSPTNAVFLRVQTGVYDPSLVGDKAKWFSHLLAHKLFQVYDESSTLAAALELQTTARPVAEDNRSGITRPSTHSTATRSYCVTPTKTTAPVSHGLVLTLLLVIVIVLL